MNAKNHPTAIRNDIARCWLNTKCLESSDFLEAWKKKLTHSPYDAMLYSRRAFSCVARVHVFEILLGLLREKDVPELITAARDMMVMYADDISVNDAVEAVLTREKITACAMFLSKFK